MLRVFLILLYLACTLSSKLSAQHQRCVSEDILDNTLSLDKAIEDYLQQTEQKYERAQRSNSSHRSRMNCDIFTIPVVVHIVYDDAQSNISDEQVLSQIEVLNQDYRNIFGTEGFGPGVDMKVQFCLASKDPDGNPTSGITRTESPLSAHNFSKDAELKNLIRWNPNNYLNFWIVREIELNGDLTLGYTWLPGTIDKNREGIVITSKFFGTEGTATPPYHRGRTATHEVGHYLGLYHTFRNGGMCADTSASSCLQVGDRVCDTPAEQDAKFECPEPSNSCIDFPCDLLDPTTNYMNFVDDECMEYFTAGQRERVHFFLNSFYRELVSRESLMATGCENNEAIMSKPVANFSQNSLSICEGSSISFEDLSEGCVSSWSWQFPGGNPSSSVQPSPVVQYNQAGIYDVRLIIANGEEADTIEKPNLIRITPAAPTRGAFSHDFEGGLLLPTDWWIENQDAKSSWLLTTLATSSGFGAAILPNYVYHAECTMDGLISAPFSIANGSGAVLNFDYAYRHADPNRPGDGLMVSVSTDCGMTYGAPIFSKRGEGLSSSREPLSNEPFIPTNALDWVNVQLDLSAYAGFNNLRVRFQSIGQGGQHLYLDNIAMGVTTGINPSPIATLRTWPNPFQDMLQIEMGLKETTIVEISLLDPLGRVILQQQSRWYPEGTHKILLSSGEFSSLSSGVYTLSVRTTERQTIKKIIKL